jgi:hypothetical protein
MLKSWKDYDLSNEEQERLREEYEMERLHLITQAEEAMNCLSKEDRYELATWLADKSR